MTLDDEGGYAVVAHELLEGGTLYQSALDRRPPLLFWLYAGLAAALGRLAEHREDGASERTGSRSLGRRSAGDRPALRR